MGSNSSFTAALIVSSNCFLSNDSALVSLFSLYLIAKSHKYFNRYPAKTQTIPVRIASAFNVIGFILSPLLSKRN